MPIVCVCRLPQALLLSLPYAVTVYYLRGKIVTADWPSDAASVLCLVLVLAGGYAVNDAADARYDGHAPLRHAVASGRITARRAALLGVALMVAGCFLAGGAAAPLFAVGLAAIAAGLLAYDLVSKRIGVLKDVVVGLLVAGIYPLAAAQVGHWGGCKTPTVPLFALWMFLSATAYEIYSDIRDRRPDRLGGGGPGPIHRRPRRWLYIANWLMGAGALPLAATAFWGLGALYSAILIPLAGVSLLALLRARSIHAKRVWIKLHVLAVGIAAVTATILGA